MQSFCYTHSDIQMEKAAPKSVLLAYDFREGASEFTIL